MVPRNGAIVSAESPRPTSRLAGPANLPARKERGIGRRGLSGRYAGADCRSPRPALRALDHAAPEVVWPLPPLRPPSPEASAPDASGEAHRRRGRGGAAVPGEQQAGWGALLFPGNSRRAPSIGPARCSSPAGGRAPSRGGVRTHYGPAQRDHSELHFEKSRCYSLGVPHSLWPRCEGP